MTRRSMVIGGVAAVAAAAGIGAGLWRTRSTASPVPNFWALQFDRPGGGRLALSRFQGRPLLLNFWATWCPPCVAELPMIDAFARGQSVADGWQVVGVAVDNLAPVVGFLAQRPVAFAIGLAGAEGIELSKNLGNSGGGLPFTVAIDRSGRVVHRKLGALGPSDLQDWATALG